MVVKGHLKVLYILFTIHAACNMHRYDLIKSLTKHINAFKRHFIWLTFFAWDKRIPTAPAMMPRKCPAKPVKNFIYIICQNATFIIRPEKIVARIRQKFLPRALIAVIQPDKCRSFNCAISSSGFHKVLSDSVDNTKNWRKKQMNWLLTSENGCRLNRWRLDYRG